MGQDKSEDKKLVDAAVLLDSDGYLEGEDWIIKVCIWDERIGP